MNSSLSAAAPLRPPALPRWKAALFISVLALAPLVMLEGLGQIYYRLRSADRRWQVGLYLETRAARGFTRHPYLGLAPIPGRVFERDGVRIRHNSLGFRGPEIALEKPSGVTRIVTLGGSSTYCVKLSDQDTWPAVLERKLGPRYQVVNLGVPGYSSVEHVIQAALWLSDLKPDILICYAGWNDAQSLHVRNLRADYSDFHSQRIADTLHVVPVDRVITPFALVRLAHGFWFRITRQQPHLPVPDEQAFTAAGDPRALSLYRRNLRSIAVLCQSQGISALFVPQLVNNSFLTNETAYGWVPFVRDKDLPGAIETFNEGMRGVARETGVAFAASVRASDFQNTDFADEGHFSREGADKFAALLAQEVKTQFTSVSTAGRAQSPSGPGP